MRRAQVKRWLRRVALSVGATLLGLSCPYWPARAQLLCHAADTVAHVVTGVSEHVADSKESDGP